MYNTDMPQRAELPTTQQLARSTILALISALVLLVAVVLPAEYGIDPTGIGRLLRLTEMGVVKQQLAAQALADAAAAQTAASAQTNASANATTAATPASEAVPASLEAARAAATWRDEIPFTLAPGQGTEIKLQMVRGAKADYAWVVTGGVVNFHKHGDRPGKSVSYEKGRAVASDDGVLEAAFTGDHGWYWRNPGASGVTVTLRTRGDYTAIKR
jgi:hypothetical protein